MGYIRCFFFAVGVVVVVVVRIYICESIMFGSSPMMRCASHPNQYRVTRTCGGRHRWFATREMCHILHGATQSKTIHHVCGLAGAHVIGRFAFDVRVCVRVCKLKITPARSPVPVDPNKLLAN